MAAKQKAETLLGDLESEIMNVVWQSHEPVSVQFVTDVLKLKRKIAYTTVMTVMSRLAEKGLLKRKEKGRAFLYHANVSKQAFLTRMTKQILKNFVTYFGEDSAAHFVEELEKLPIDRKYKMFKKLKNEKN